MRARSELARASLNHQLWVVVAHGTSFLIHAAVLLSVSNEAKKTPTPKQNKRGPFPAACFSF